MPMRKIAFVFMMSALLSLAAAMPAGAQVIAFGHTQRSGMSSASFGILRTEYDSFTDYFYWNELNHEKELRPAVFTGIDENYWNVGAGARYRNLALSLLFYEQIANYKNWPANMTDLGVVVNLGIGSGICLQARYYDFCYSGGKGTAMPGGTAAYLFGDGDFRHRIAASLDWAFWYLEPWYSDVMFARPALRYELSSDGSNGLGLGYKASIPLEGPGNETDVSDVAVSHTFSLWGGVTKDIEDFTVGVRPEAFITLNAVNPTDLPKNKKGETEDYNPFARRGNKEFHIFLPATVSYHLTEKVEIIAAVFFGLYYANFDHAIFARGNGITERYSGIGGSNNKGWVNEKGIGIGLNFEISPRCSLQIGSSFTRIPELTGNETGSASDNHSYKAENLSAAAIAKSPLSVSGKFRF